MVVVGLFLWWYGVGWLQRIRMVQTRLVGLYDYFSIDLLLRTLFLPFRQISAVGVKGPIGVQIRAWFDRLISRIIGAVVRIVVIVVGCGALLVAGSLGIAMIILWPVVPLLPVVTIVLMMSGWIPWKI